MNHGRRCKVDSATLKGIAVRSARSCLLGHPPFGARLHLIGMGAWRKALKTRARGGMSTVLMAGPATGAGAGWHQRCGDECECATDEARIHKEYKK